MARGSVVYAVLSMMLGLVIAACAGLAARELFQRGRPGVAVALVAGLMGTVAGSPVAHMVSGDHEFHAFRPESFIAGFLGAILLLALYRGTQERTRGSEPRLFS